MHLARYCPVVLQVSLARESTYKLFGGPGRYAWWYHTLFVQPIPGNLSSLENVTSKSATGNLLGQGSAVFF